MMEDTFEGLDEDNIEEEAEEEVNKVLFQITDGKSIVHGASCTDH